MRIIVHENVLMWQDNAVDKLRIPLEVRMLMKSTNNMLASELLRTRKLIAQILSLNSNKKLYTSIIPTCSLHLPCEEKKIVQKINTRSDSRIKIGFQKAFICKPFKYQPTEEQVTKIIACVQS